MRAWLIRVWLWGPVVLQMAVIFVASSIPDLREIPGGVPASLGHVAGYCILGGLALRAFAAGRLSGVSARAAAAALLLASLYGVSDELHQVVVPGRSADLADLAWDAGGAAIAVAAGWFWRQLAAARR